MAESRELSPELEEEIFGRTREEYILDGIAGNLEKAVEQGREAATEDEIFSFTAVERALQEINGLEWGKVRGVDDYENVYSASPSGWESVLRSRVYLVRAADVERKIEVHAGHTPEGVESWGFNIYDAEQDIFSVEKGAEAERNWYDLETPPGYAR